MDREEFLRQLPGLVSGYQPAYDVLKHIGRISVLIIVGPSGVGKTTLVNNLDLTYVLSDNTRSPRPGEKEGIDFYFRSDYQQVVHEIKTGRFVQVAVDSGGDLKATKASSYPASGDVVMAVVADVVPIFRNLGFVKTTTAFITPPSFAEWMRRTKQHHLTKEQFNKRMAEAERSFSFALSDNATHFILSDQVAPAVKQLKDLLAARADIKREQQAKQAAADMLLKLKNQFGIN